MKALLSRVANSLGASGVIVWVGSADGADLRPVLAHGYPPQTLSRMTAIARTADNAAAAAYRTGSFQMVRATHNATCRGRPTARARRLHRCPHGGSRAGNEPGPRARHAFAAQLSGTCQPRPASRNPSSPRPPPLAQLSHLKHPVT
jgi:hypothetical protein